MTRRPVCKFAKLQIRVALMTGFTALGIPVIEAVG